MSGRRTELPHPYPVKAMPPYAEATAAAPEPRDVAEVLDPVIVPPRPPAMPPPPPPRREELPQPQHPHALAPITPPRRRRELRPPPPPPIRRRQPQQQQQQQQPIGEEPLSHMGAPHLHPPQWSPMPIALPIGARPMSSSSSSSTPWQPTTDQQQRPPTTRPPKINWKDPLDLFPSSSSDHSPPPESTTGTYRDPFDPVGEGNPEARQGYLGAMQSLLHGTGECKPQPEAHPPTTPAA
jgi:hypothetical protein